MFKLRNFSPENGPHTMQTSLFYKFFLDIVYVLKYKENVSHDFM
jgi:hypothetical protein